MRKETKKVPGSVQWWRPSVNEVHLRNQPQCYMVTSSVPQDRQKAFTECAPTCIRLCMSPDRYKHLLETTAFGWYRNFVPPHTLEIFQRSCNLISQHDVLVYLYLDDRHRYG
jgi:hypothetical protein